MSNILLQPRVQAQSCPFSYEKQQLSWLQQHSPPQLCLLQQYFLADLIFPQFILTDNTTK